MTQESVEEKVKLLIPHHAVPKDERIALLEQIIDGAGTFLDTRVRNCIVRSASWIEIFSTVLLSAARLGYSWELSYDSGKRITGEYLHDQEGKMLNHDQVEAGVREGTIPVMIDVEQAGFHVGLGQWGRYEPLRDQRQASIWLLDTLVTLAREELEELTNENQAG